jgi:NADPH-dependent 2,4-dienoyl-CoA reductase/sulfur reductase-like enzyme
MHAAIALAECGVACTLIDEGFDLGGQIYRPPTSPGRAPSTHPTGERLRSSVRAHTDRIDVRTNAVVWGIFDGLGVALGTETRSELLRPRAIVLATGAYEYVSPFPGWTLPGVMTPGAGQILAKTMGVTPGERVLVAGTGPFLLAVAAQLVKLGIRVLAVLEASPRAPWLSLPLHGWRTPGILREGLGYWRALARARVPVRFGRMVVSASGDESLQSVVHAPVDRRWLPDRSRAESEDADALLIGYGFVPRVQLAQVAGCRLELRPSVGGWVPCRDANLETSVPGVFAAGDGAGVAGSLVAAHEGRLAGLAAARRLGAIDERALARARRPIDRELARLAPIRRALDRISLLQPGLASLVDDDTTICRCEEVTWREVRGAMRSGCTHYRSLKVVTRVGMGACQGRFCWPSASRLLAGEAGCDLAELGPASARPPVRPVTLGALASLSQEEA